MAVSSASIRPESTTPSAPAFPEIAARPSMSPTWKRSPTAWLTRWSPRVTAHPMPHDIEHLYLTDPIGEPCRHQQHHVFRGRAGICLSARRRAISATWGRGSAAPSASASPADACRGRCCRPANASRHRATGTSEYSVQLSGNTSSISAPGVLLPRRNLQVLLPPFVCEETIDPQKLAAAIRSHMTAFDVDPDREVALALRWTGMPSYERLSAFAEGIGAGSPNASPGSSRCSSCSTATWRRRSAISCKRTARRERDAGDRRRRAYGTSTISISAASACRPTRCRSPSNPWCSARTRAARGRASACIIMIMIMTMITGRTAIRT